jgi:hypothetical protein
MLLQFRFHQPVAAPQGAIQNGLDQGLGYSLGQPGPIEVYGIHCFLSARRTPKVQIRCSGFRLSHLLIKNDLN